MEKEARLKYSLAFAVSLFLILNSALVWLTANSQPLISAQDTIPIGIKWLFLFGTVILAVGIAYWAHRAFLLGGVSPLETTWVDIVIVLNAVLTILALLFISEAYWALAAALLLFVFLFSAFVLRRLIESAKGWVSWLIATIILSFLIILLISTLLPTV